MPRLVWACVTYDGTMYLCLGIIRSIRRILTPTLPRSITLRRLGRCI